MVSNLKLILSKKPFYCKCLLNLLFVDCAEHRETVEYNTISSGEYSVTNENGAETPKMLFYGSGATEPQDVPNEYLTMIFNLGQSGIKKLISLSFKGEHINLIKVIATKDSDELTESREHVRIIFMNYQKSEHNSFGNAIYRNGFIYFLCGLFYMI